MTEPVPVFGVELRLIEVDHDLQPRVSTDLVIAQEYGLAMAKGEEFPPLDVFYDGDVYWLADGFHRFHAGQALGLPFMDCRVHEGTRDDALWFTCGANAKNGVRRTRNDVQLSIRRALLHPNGAGKADSAIADHVGCSVKTVSSMRRDLEATLEIPKSDVRVGKDGRTINIAGISAAQAQGKPLDAPGPVAGMVEASTAPAAQEPAPAPVQIDLEEIPGAKGGPKVAPLIDPRWAHLSENLRGIVRAHGALPDAAQTAENFPEVLAHILTIEDVAAIAAWWADFLPLWTARQPEIQRYQARILAVRSQN